MLVSRSILGGRTLPSSCTSRIASLIATYEAFDFGARAR
jgi:hypothetical protein